MTHEPKWLAFDIKFTTIFGLFHVGWSVAESAIDYAIGQFLQLASEQTHLLTAGIDHGRKIMLLRDLIARSDHANRTELLRTLKIIQNESLRNVLAHSYIASDDKTITFIERRRGGPYSVKLYEFTLKEFRDHVRKFTQAAQDFEKALGFTREDLSGFLNAASSASHKS